MKLIIPMAGRGTRVRPHSHVTPKPLLSVRGKSMVERIVSLFSSVLPRPLTTGVFILGPDFGEGVREELREICARYNMDASFKVQEVARGTAHAVHCAGDQLEGEGIVVFADTLFEMDPVPALDSDVVMWVKHVDDPRRFGVAVREGDRVVRLVEKPAEIISTEALIGIYYVKDLTRLSDEIDYLIEHNVTGHGDEYQLTDAFDRMIQADAFITTATVNAWLDCGTIPALLETTKALLDREDEPGTQAGSATNSVLIPPVYLGPGATVTNSVLGPHVSIEAGAKVSGSVLSDTILFEGASVENARLHGSLVGRSAVVAPAPAQLNIGDHAEVR
jgi:glucose-1-phosphate thymidylyltransferase